MPTGSTISWAVSNSTVASVPPNSTSSSVTVTPTGANGTTSLIATVQHCTFTYTIYFPIKVGTFTSDEFDIYTEPVGQPFCVNQTVTFGPSASQLLPSTTTTYSWQWLSSSWTYVSGQGTRFLQLKPKSSVTSGWVALVAGNPCGTSPVKMKTFTINPNCQSAFSVSPNPSSDVINIGQSAESESSVPVNIVQVEIIDRMGNLKTKKDFGKGQISASLNVSSLPSDTYFLRIFDGNVWYSHQVIIRH